MAKYKKRADGRYAKQITVGYRQGKPIKKTVYGKTISEVEKKYRDLMLLVDRNAVIDNQWMTVRELYDEWYRLKKKGKVRASTAYCHRSTENRIKNSIGDMKVKDVKKYNIEVMVDDMLNEGVISRARTVLQTTRTMYDYAINHDIVYKNPCLDITVKYEPGKKRILTEDEKLNIENADSLSLSDKTFLFLLRYTGMRRGEIFALHKDDISDGCIHVKSTLQVSGGIPYIGLPKTDAGDRYIPVFLKLIQPLQEYLKTVDNYLFLNRNGNLMADTSQVLMFDRIKKKVGLGDDLTMHCFRHNFISECYAAGIDIKKVQAWVGHDDIRTTLDIYTELSKQEIQDGSKMNDFYDSQKEVKPKLKEVKTL